MSKAPQERKDGLEINDFLARYGDFAPVVIDFINNNPDSMFSKILAVIAGFVFKDGAAEFPPVAEDIKPLLAERAVQKIDHTHAAKAYYDAIGENPDQAPQKITTHYKSSKQDIELTLQKFVNDTETGFRGAIYKDGQGHSVVFYGGMDVLRGMDSKDVEAMAQAKLMKQGVNQQTGPSQELYLEAVRTSESTEIVGYSLGAMLANDIAARLDAKATTIADIGLPDVKNTDGKSMYSAEHIQNVRENVTVLKGGTDSYFAKAGKVHGSVINVPTVSGTEVLNAMAEKNPTLTETFNANSNLMGHHPLAYVLGSAQMQTTEQAAITGTVTGPGAPLKSGN